jgi:branched-chain amino acid transport system substrate-binding protein
MQRPAHRSPTSRAAPRVAVTLASVVAILVTACGGAASPSPSPAASAPASQAPSQQASGSPASTTPIKIGILTTCGGPFATFEAESFSGAKYALVKYAGGTPQGTGPQDGVAGASVAGRPIQILFGCSDATPDVAVQQARRLVEGEKVDILLGPLSGDEGVAIANYAKTQPNVTFVNGTSGAQVTTLQVKAENFFRFGGDGAQWMAGLGTYAYKVKGWRKMAILAEDYSYPYTLAAGFVQEFCSLGGQITSRTWVPLTVTDYSSYVAQLPRDVDGILLLTGGTNTIAAEKAFQDIGGNPGKQMVGGSSVMDPTSFSVGDALVGLVGGVPVPLGGTAPEWVDFVNGFKSVYPDVPADSLFTVLYYDGMQAIIQGLEKVNGDLSDGEKAFREALKNLNPTFPNGQVRLDENRNSIQPAYIVQITKQAGQLGFTVLKKVENVDETFGGAFGPNSPAPGRDVPACQPGTPPPWSAGF